MDASLREIAEHLQREVDISRKRDTQIEFALVYKDYTGNYRRKHIGAVKVGHMAQDDLKSLQTLRYQIGDFISIAIIEQDYKKEPNKDYSSMWPNNNEKNDKREERRSGP